MPRIIKVEFTINGASTGTQTIACGSSNTLTGTFTVFLAWDRAEQLIGRAATATIKLVRAGRFWVIFGPKVFIRDHGVPTSAADPAVPNFVFPGPYEIIGPLLGWKVTSITTTYTFKCGTDCKLTVTSSRGGTYTDDSNEKFTGLCSLRAGGSRYDRQSDSNVTVQCAESRSEVGYYLPENLEEEAAVGGTAIAALANRIEESERRSELLIAQAVEDIALLIKPGAIELDKRAILAVLRQRGGSQVMRDQTTAKRASRRKRKQ
jgi:hypothetical protein